MRRWAYVSQQTVPGPTQTAREGAAAEWSPRPVVAGTLRLTILVFPYVVSMGAALAISQWWSAERAGLHPLLWWIAVAIASTLTMIPADRLIRRIVPISSLLTISLTFPDAAPTRFRAAMRSWTTTQVKRRVSRAVENSAKGEFVDRSQYMLDLISLLTVHDRMTRGHSERVRAYSSLLGEEMRLSKEEHQKLYWAALLHDIGKLDVPAKILNKSGPPTKAEWVELQTHPAAAIRYLEPLRGWLGPWSGAADEHHLRWDGLGYPKSIGGTDISKAGRIVAVADAYDVMTCARSYKAGMDPADARVELLACAGGQFDPTVVRAFLNIGLKRMRLAGGPLAALPVLLRTLLTGAAANGGKVLLATSAITAGVAVSPAVEPPLIPAVLAYVDDSSDWLMSGAEAALAALSPDEPTPAPASLTPELMPAGTPQPTTTAAEPTPTTSVVTTAPPAELPSEPAAPQPTVEPEAQPQPTVEPEAQPQPTVEPEAQPQPTVEPDPSASPPGQNGNGNGNNGNGSGNLSNSGNGNGNGKGDD